MQLACAEVFCFAVEVTLNRSLFSRYDHTDWRCRRCSYVNSRASSRRNSFEHECHEAESKIPTIHVQDVSMPDNEITRKLQGYSMA